MADTKTSIIIERSANGVKKQQSVTNVNPSASNAEMYQFAQAMAALSTDTFEGASRVDRTELNANVPYRIVGADTICDSYWDQSTKSQAPSSTYSVVSPDNETVNQCTVKATLPQDYESEAFIQVDFDGSPQAEVFFFSKVNEYIEIPVTISAAGDFGTLAKVIKCIGIKEFE